MKFTYAALVADALSLGPHWVYDQKSIANLYPQGVRKFTDPMTEYHLGKRAGDLTHYGDQLIMLVKSVQKRSGFDLEGWRSDWLSEMQSYAGYVDGATRATLASEGRAASPSSDLGGAARIAAILDLGLSLEQAIEAARAQTTLTHGDPAVADAAEFFVRVSDAVSRESEFGDALKFACESGQYQKLDVHSHLMQAHALQSTEFHQAAETLGQACGVEEAFPLSLYFLLRPEPNFGDTLSDNALAGGDNSARAMLIALPFAAKNPEVATPWLSDLNAY